MIESAYALFFPLILAVSAAYEFLPIDPAIAGIAFAAVYSSFLLCAIAMTRGYHLIVTTACFVAGIAVVAAYRLGPGVWIAALDGNASVIALFAVIPAISIPIRRGAYLEAFGKSVSRLQGRPGAAFVFLAVVHVMMSVVLNIGSIPAMRKLLGKAGLPKKYLSLVYSAGYSAYMVFSPFDGLINIMILSAGTVYASYFPYGLSMVFLIMVVCTGLLLSDRALMEELSKEPVRDEGGKRDSKTVEFIVHLTLMIGLAATASRYLHPKNPSMGIAAVISGYSFFWVLALKVPFEAIKADREEYAASLVGYRNFLPFLVSAGFLGAMVSHTPFKAMIGTALASLRGLPPYFVLQAFMLTTIVLSLAGIHMMITTAAMAFTVSPAMIGLSAPGYALLLLTCWFTAMNASPFAPFSAVVAEAIGESPVKVALGYNIRLSAVMLFLAPLPILLLG